MKIIVDAEAGTINVDGTQFKCLGGAKIAHLFPGAETPEPIKFVRWYDNSGQVELLDGRLVNFTDFTEMKGYLDIWTLAKAADDKRIADARAAHDKHNKDMADRIKAEEDDRAANEKKVLEAFERARPMNEALAELGTADHEVIKAMERKLIAEGHLPRDFGKKRDLLRETVKAERKKLGK
jgi:hypothetical protein